MGRAFDAASHRNREGELIAIGREMFGCLDEAGWASAWADGPGERRLEILTDAAESDAAAALLDAPWELLARGHGPLALDDQMLQVVRRVGAAGTALDPAHGDIRLMFMAAAPAGQTVLDYEAEEAGILSAAGGQQRLKLVVEETGSLEALGSRLTSNEGPFEALHLLCLPQTISGNNDDEVRLGSAERRAGRAAGRADGRRIFVQE